MAPSATVARSRAKRTQKNNKANNTTSKSLASKLHVQATEEGVRKVWKLIKDNNIKIVDLKFNDLPGLWQHFSSPIQELDEDFRKGIWADGIGFDGSSIRGFQKIHISGKSTPSKSRQQIIIYHFLSYERPASYSGW